MVELIWDGKTRNGKRVPPVRLGLPFQTVETVNEGSQDRQRTLDMFARGSGSEWRNRLIWGDKKYVLPSLLRDFGGKGLVNLIYIDPPFDTGADFSLKLKVPDSDNEVLNKQPSIIEQKAYRDTWGRGLDSYLQWFYETVVLLRDLLAEDGSIYVHLDPNVVHYAKAVMDEVYGAENFQREVIWRMGWISGYKSKATNWIRNHDNILFYVRDKDRFTFNKEYIPYPSGYVRRDGNEPVGEGVPVDDVWNGHPLDEMNSIQLMSFSKEKVGYPTQKNEALLERIIRASSNEGDLVLDCFAGSGTTATVAERLGRRWVTSDLGRFAIHTTRKRLLSIPQLRPFVVQNLGKYERRAWAKAEFDSPADAETAEVNYRQFILELFRASPRGDNAWLHGVRSGRHVHVGPVDAPVTLDDVHSIVQEIQRLHPPEGVEPVGVDILAWDFAFELNEVATEVARNSNISVRFRRIPREVLEQAAVEQGDIGPKDFFELRALSTQITQTKRTVRVEISDFIFPSEDLPKDAASSIRHFSQWIDYWAIDWNNRGDTFHNEDQSFRTRKTDLKLALSKTYESAGTYIVMIKVIDILGNDTTKKIQLDVE